MIETVPARKKRMLVRCAVFLGALTLVVSALAAWYLTSARFQEQVRRKLLADLEQMSGGRAELSSFHFVPSRLEFETRDLTLHGLESPGEAPYAHVDRVMVRLKILSLFRRQIGIRTLELAHPVIHILIHPDGTTNQPTPGSKATGEPAVGVLFEVAMNRLQVERGELFLNDRRVPLELTARDLRATMIHASADAPYDAHIQVAALETKYATFGALKGKSEADLALGRSKLELRSFTFESQRSRVEAHGTLTDLRDPRMEFAYSGSFDLVELGAIVRVPELRRGQMKAIGQGTYHAQDLTSSGRLIAEDVEWREPKLRVPELTAAANYSLHRDHLLISELTAQALGGLITGRAELSNWILPTAGGRLQTRQHGTTHLRLSRVQIGAAARAVSTPELPLDGINPAGAASGTVDLTWTGSPRNMDATIALDVGPPANPRPRQLPVAAQVQAVYRGSQAVLDIAHLNIATRATRFSAAGVLGSSSARLGVTLNTGDVAELQPILAAFHKPSIPAEVHGRAAFTGSVVGKLAGPVITGHFEISDFDADLPATWRLVPAGTGASAPPSTRRMHWDLLSADVVYSPNELSLHRGLLRRSAAHARFDLTATLHAGELEDTSAIRGRFNAINADLQDLQFLAGTAYPMGGKLSLSVNLGGTRANPNGQGTLEITGGTLAGERFQSLRAALLWSGRQVGLDNLVLTHNGAQLTGNLAYNFADTGFHLDLTGANFQLSKFQRLQWPRLTTAGVAAFRLQGSGTLTAPTINIELRILDLLLNKEQVGQFELTGVSMGPDLHLTAHSRFQTAELTVDGEIRLREDFPADLTLHFAHLDIDPLLRAYLDGKVTGHSSSAGAVHLRGTLLHPRDLNITGRVDEFSAEVEKVGLETEGPIQFSLANEFLTLDHLHLKAFQRTPAKKNGAALAGPTDITAGGVIQVGGEYQMNFRADGVLDFGLLQSFHRDLASSGTMQINVAVTGTLARPETRGQVRVVNGAVSYIDLPNGLSNINGTLIFNENRLQVQSLTAQTGGGTLTLGGLINYSHGLSFDLTATSKDIRLRYPAGVSSYANADLRFSGTLDNSLLAGTVTISKFGVSPQFDLAYYLQRFSLAPSGASPQSPLNNVRFDLHIVTAQELQVEMSVAKLSGNADLRLRGTASHPVLLGRVDIAQGNLDIGGTKYHLERGDIVFSNPTTIAPVIDMEATARVRDYDISLGLHGPMAHPNINYRSDPPLPTSDIIALLALGRTHEESVYYQTGPNQSLTELTSNAVLEQAIASAYSSRAQRLFGAGRIKIDPQAGGAENNPNARVTIEQQVSDKVTLTFISNLSQSAQEIVQVEYNINRRLSVVAVRDQNGVLSFDVRYRQRKR